jgi:hypothetical protein
MAHPLTLALSKYKCGQMANPSDYYMVQQYYGETTLWYNMSANGIPTVFVGKQGRYGKAWFVSNGIKTQPLLLKMLAAHEAKNGCKAAKRPTKEARVKSAFRKAIKGQIDAAYSETSWPHTCPLSGKTFQQHERHLMHVDHRSADSQHHPFSTILRLFLQTEGLDIELVKLDIAGNLKSESLVRNWQHYHARFADLVPVCKEFNMKKGAKRDQQTWEPLSQTL